MSQQFKRHTDQCSATMTGTSAARSRSRLRGSAIALLTCLIATGCASKPGGLMGGPIVDLKGVNRVTYASDLAECEAYAQEVNAVKKTAVAAVGGAVVGGLIGAAVGNSDIAKRSAGGGAIWGGARGGVDGVREKNQVIRSCLIGRGYRVLN